MGLEGPTTFDARPWSSRAFSTLEPEPVRRGSGQRRSVLGELPQLDNMPTISASVDHAELEELIQRLRPRGLAQWIDKDV